jgi:hypothetical protein
MTLKHPAWKPVLWLLSLANVAAVWFAAMPGEPLHATSHAVLAVLFGLAAQRVGQRQEADADEVAGRLEELDAGQPDLTKLQGVEGRIAQLEERLDFTERALVDVRSRAQRPPKEE